MNYVVHLSAYAELLENMLNDMIIQREQYGL